MTKERHPNEGSSLEDFLREEGILEQTTVAAIKRVFAFQLKEAMKSTSLTKTAMAARMDTSRAQLDRLLDPDNGNVTIETLTKAAHAVGRSVRLELA